MYTFCGFADVMWALWQPTVGTLMAYVIVLVMTAIQDKIFIKMCTLLKNVFFVAVHRARILL